MTYDELIVAYVGIDSIRLYQPLDVVKATLNGHNVVYSTEVWQAKYETVPNPWTVLVIRDTLSLFFAKNRKLFKMVFFKGYTGQLPNGIHIGMSIEKAQLLDSSLKYDAWNEVYVSKQGYWLEDDVETETITSISVYIKELLDEEDFDHCIW
jgi:hypothetical protein